MSTRSLTCICGKDCSTQAGLEACLRSHLLDSDLIPPKHFPEPGHRNSSWSECWCGFFGFRHDLEENSLALSEHILENSVDAIVHYLDAKLRSP